MTKKIILALFILTMVLAISCMKRPSRPKRTKINATNSSQEENFTINVDADKTVNIPVDTGDFWQENEELTEIYSNQILDLSGTYIYNGFPEGDEGLRYKVTKNLDLVDPKKNDIVYKKYIKTVLVKVNLYTTGVVKEQYVAGGIYQVVKEKDEEKRIEHQPAINGYEILVYNYNSKDRLKVPNNTMQTLSHLYRYYLPTADANSEYDPDKVFTKEYPKINDAPADWFILPEKYKAN